jgi:hypothetical protein
VSGTWGCCSRYPYSPRCRSPPGWRSCAYRLYEIDRIINRTLVYGLLTAVLGLGYAAGSLLFALVAGAGAEPPSWLIAAATLAAAAVFRPVRGRIQAVVDRRFNRRRYHAARPSRRSRPPS